MPTITQYPTTATANTGTWGTTANATGSGTGTYATWASSTSGATATLDLAGFDFSGVPAGADINSVTLVFRHYTNSVSGANTMRYQLLSGGTSVQALTVISATEVSTVTEQTIAATSLPTADQLRTGFTVRYQARKATNTTATTVYLDRVAVTVDYSIPAPAPKMSTLTQSTWAGQTAFTLDAGATIVGDTLQLAVPAVTSTYPTVFTSQKYDMVGESFTVEWLGLPANTNAAIEVLCGVRPIGDSQWTNGAGFGYSGGSFVAYEYKGGVYAEDGSWGNYSLTTHKYLRIRESGGTTYWEHSPDYTTWTQMWSRPNAFSMASVSGFMEVGMYQAVTNPGYATFGKINTSGAVAPPADAGPDQTVAPWTTVTLTGTGTGTWSQTSGATVTLGGSGATRTFTAPPSMSTQALVFSYGGDTTTVTVTRARHGIVKTNGGAPTPVRLFVQPGAITPPPSGTVQTQNVSYTASTDSIPNPERGWYGYTETHWTTAAGAGQEPLDQAELTARRTGSYTQSQVTKTISHTTLVYRYYVMEYMRGVDTLPAAFLTLLQNDLTAARNAGVKMIPRFVYDIDDNTNMTPPYNADTTLARTFSHIDQLKGVLNDNAEVIYALQAGFIGLWGEWYYSDNWGDEANVSTAKWDERYRLLTKLLTDLDPRIPVLVRYPGIKRRYLSLGSGTGWTAHPDALTRIGFHNDAFVGDDGPDMGTYDNYTDGASVTQMKDYVAAETARPVPMVGENNFITSRSAYSNYSAEAAQMHFSALNPEYAVETIKAFSQAQFDTISKALGYRLRLTSATLPSSGAASATVSVTLSITNDGYAGPTTSRPLQLVFVNGATVVTRTLARDVRTLLPGSHTVTETVTLPPTTGTYTMHLALPDLELTGDAYAIRLANTTTWANGRNALGASVTVT